MECKLEIKEAVAREMAMRVRGEKEDGRWSERERERGGES